MERRLVALHNEHEQKLTEARKALSEKDSKVLRYKKQLRAQKIARPRGARKGVPECMDEDELDISGMPGGFPSSQPSHGELCSKGPTYEFEEPLLIRADQGKL